MDTHCTSHITDMDTGNTRHIPQTCTHRQYTPHTTDMDKRVIHATYTGNTRHISQTWTQVIYNTESGTVHRSQQTQIAVFTISQTETRK